MAADGTQPALAFDRVSKRYGTGVLALQDVSFTIKPGARACLLGPNGAGKSTAIRLLEGALRPTGGRLQLLGTAVDSGAYLAARRRTAVVPQAPGMYADLTTAEFLEVVRRLYRRGDAARAMAAFGLTEYATTRMAHLSGGFQRRVVLAAALLAEPEVLLLDEPTVGLDPLAAHDVHDYLKGAMPGRTTLLCTHNLAEAEALCDEVLILRKGKVLVHESLTDLRKRSQPRLRLAARQGSQPLLEAVRRRGLEASVEGDGPWISVRVQNIEAETPGLLRGVLADGLDVYACEPVQASLEDLFLDVVREPE
jgi:ABC-2 type transport system ATP-binding protein